MDLGGWLTKRGRSHQNRVSLPQKRKAVLMGLEALATDPSDYGSLCLDPHVGVKALLMAEKSCITKTMPPSVSSVNGSEARSPDPVDVGNGDRVGSGNAPALATKRQGGKAVMAAETPIVTLLLPMSGSTLNGPVLVKGYSVNRPVPVKGYLGIFATVAHSKRPFCLVRPVYHCQGRFLGLAGLVLPPVQADLDCKVCPTRAKSDTGVSILLVFVMPISWVQELEIISLSQKRGTDLLPTGHHVTVSSEVCATKVGKSDFSNCGVAVHVKYGSSDANEASNAVPDGYAYGSSDPFEIVNGGRYMGRRRECENRNVSAMENARWDSYQATPMSGTSRMITDFGYVPLIRSFWTGKQRAIPNSSGSGSHLIRRTQFGFLMDGGTI